MDYKEIVTRILTEYNSITKSRTRWVRNRKELKNNWKELFEVLETASGRDGRKLVVFDKDWHKVADKGGVRGAMNKNVDEVETLQPAKADYSQHQRY